MKRYERAAKLAYLVNQLPRAVRYKGRFCRVLIADHSIVLYDGKLLVDSFIAEGLLEVLERFLEYIRKDGCQTFLTYPTPNISSHHEEK